MVEQAEGFRGPQVCTLVGITYRQLEYWARTGLLQPYLATAQGSGPSGCIPTGTSWSSK